jgi:hypothetical protein
MDIDLKQILRTAAPMLGTALGGPFGAVAGKLVAEALGNPDAKPDEIARALAVATPEQMLQLKQAEQDFQARMAELGYKNTEQLAALAADVAKSEAQELTKRLSADMASDSWLSKNVRPGTLVYILTAYLLLAVLDGTGLKVSENYVTLLGQWGMLVMSFYFGGRSVEKVMEIISNKGKTP